jgi:hypothetical protein
MVPNVFAEAATPGVFFNIGATPDQNKDFWVYATSLETKLGRNFAGFRFNSTSAPRCVTVYNEGFDRGWHWTYVNGKPKPLNNVYTGYWRDTANGLYDSFWNTYFATIRSNPRWTTLNPIHFSYHHEQCMSSEGGGLTNGMPADYIAAFRHVRELMDVNCAHVSQGGNMQMCWAPHWLQIRNTVNPFHVSKCNPGVEYYDLLGVDVYNTTSATYAAVSQWTPIHDYAVSIGKPFFSGEQGVAGTDGKVVTYLKDLDLLLKSYGAGTGPGNIVSLCITTKPSAGGDYRMDSTPAILAQYKSMANDPFYRA